jgi:hypothetical protein
MKTLFQHFNFVRVITLLSLFGAAALGVLDWKQRQRLLEMRAALAPGGKVEELSSRIQENGLLFTEIENDLKSDKLADHGSLETYIRSLAANPDNVKIGSVKVTPRTSRSGNLPKGMVDDSYDIVPQVAADSFRRESISNFFMLMETNSPRIRVTELRIENADTKAKPFEVPGDKWTFKGTVTSRKKVE